MSSPTVGFPTVRRSTRMLPNQVRQPLARLDRQFLFPIDHRYYYQSFIRFLIYFPSYVAPANQVFIFGRASRLGSSQSWVNSGLYLAPKHIIQRLKALVYKDSVSKLLAQLRVLGKPIALVRNS